MPRGSVGNTEGQGDLSPELVLVSPELGRVARASLPDRPWEIFVPSVLSPPPTTARAQGQGVAPPAREVGSTPISGRPSRKPSLLVVHRLVVVAFAALLVLGSILPVRDAPTLTPALARQLGTTPAAKAQRVGSIVPPLQASPSPSRGHVLKSRPATGAKPKKLAPASHHPVRQVSPPAPTPTTVRDRHLPKVAFRFDIRQRGHLIEQFTGTLRCAGRVALANIAIGVDSRFSVMHRFSSGRRAVIVWLDGAVDRGGSIRGTFRVRRDGCETGQVAFSAQAEVR